MKKIILMLTLMFSVATLQAKEFKEGVHYKKLPAKVAMTGDKVNVSEFFWYGCSHCFSFEPYVQKWKKTKAKNVEFEQVPTVFRPSWEVQAKTYYALKNLGVVNQLHGDIFDYLHIKRKQLNTLEQVVAFIEKKGVDKAKFIDEYNSFGVSSSIRKAKTRQTDYHIEGVPSVVINGKYITGARMAGDYNTMLEIIDYLVKKESAKK